MGRLLLITVCSAFAVTTGVLSAVPLTCAAGAAEWLQHLKALLEMLEVPHRILYGEHATPLELPEG